MNIGDSKTYKTDIAIIGAGASGMMAALSVKPGLNIVLIDHNDRVGKKILSTGNGKCNLGHRDLDKADYYGSGSDRILTYLDKFGTEDMISFFESIGLYIRDREGYLYPYSETAASVLDILRYETELRGIRTLTEFETDNIELKDNSDGAFRIRGKNGIQIISKKLIIATGGTAAPKSGSDGSIDRLLAKFRFRMVPRVPALVKVKSDSNLCKSLDGVRAKGHVRLVISGKSDERVASDSASNAAQGKILSKPLSDRGEIQFTKDGLSGIPVFNLSREIGYALKTGKKCSLEIDLLPDMHTDALVQNIKSRLQSQSFTYEQLLTGLVNKKIMLSVMNMAGLKANSICSLNDLGRIEKYFEYLKKLTFNITETYGFETAQVTAGGIDFCEVDENMQAVRFPGLYLVGEIMDIDGKCGGYNLQWAWTSGHIAGCHAGLKL